MLTIACDGTITAEETANGQHTFSCSSGWTSQEFVTSEALASNFLNFFELSAADVSYITAYMMVAFITGHGIGRVARMLGR